jgi:DNA-binding response OmpR family regulator
MRQRSRGEARRGEELTVSSIGPTVHPQPVPVLGGSPPARLLAIEDNATLAELIYRGLAEQGCIVDVTHSGRDGEELATTGGYDAIILDLVLPDHDGVDLCRNLRRRGIGTPVLMLTALSATAAKIAGLEAGADDYLAKPFELDELIARVRALHRRASSADSVVLRFHDIEVNLVKRTVTRAGREISLTARELSLLEYLVRNPDRVLTRTTLAERVWDLHFETDTNVIEVYISRLRTKVDRGFDSHLIHTVPGTGYMLSTAPLA